MEQIYYYRSFIFGLYKRNEILVNFLLRFLLALFLFGFIRIYCYPSDFFKIISAPPFGLIVLILLSIAFASFSNIAGFCLLICYFAVQFSGVLTANIFIILLLLCVLFLYVRIAPKETIFIFLTILCLYFKIPLLVPLIAALFYSGAAFIPIIIGAFLYETMVNTFIFASTMSEKTSSASGSIETLFTAFIQGIFINQNFIMYAFLLTLVFIVVYGISHIYIDYAKEIAVGLGSVAYLIGFAIIAPLLNIDVNIVGLMVATLSSALIAEAMNFCAMALDFQHTEHLSFEDDENFYYVKVIPKINVEPPKKAVKRISGHTSKTNDNGR